VKHRTSFELSSAIISTLRQFRETGQGEELSTCQLARAVGVVPSSWFREVLFRLWYRHWLARDEALHWSGNTKKFFWSVAPGTEDYYE